MTDRQASSPPPGPPEPPRRSWPRQHKVLIALIALFALIALITLSVVMDARTGGNKVSTARPPASPSARPPAASADHAPGAAPVKPKPTPPSTSPSAPHKTFGPNLAALRVVRAFDMQPNPSPPNGDWEAFIIPLNKAADMATDDQLKVYILQYANDLAMNGTDAYTGKDLTNLIDYARAVYHFDVFPGG